MPIVSPRMVRSTSITIGVLLLSGCVSAKPISPTQYASIVEALKGSPLLRRGEIRNCAATARATPREKTIMAQLMNLPAGRDPIPVACQRIVDATASGRFGYRDFQNVRAGEITPQTIRILQAR